MLFLDELPELNFNLIGESLPKYSQRGSAALFSGQGHCGGNKISHITIRKEAALALQLVSITVQHEYLQPS